MNVEVNQIDVEWALHDVMSNVCKYLKVKDLYNLARVSKSWRDAVWREKAKRCYIQQLLLPYKLNNERELGTPSLPSLLHVIPFVSLLIYNNRSGQRELDNVNEVLNNFRKKLPGKALVTLVDSEDFLIINDEKLEGSKDECMFQMTGNHNFLGLFFPNVKQRVRTRVAYWTFGRETDVNLAVDKLAQKLCLDDCEYPKSTLLMLNSQRYSFTNIELVIKLIRRLGNRIKDGKDTVWADAFADKLSGTCYSGCEREKQGNFYHYQSIVALRISGPTIESWCCIINSGLNYDEVEDKLNNFKKKVTPNKRYYIGLFYIPSQRSFLNRSMLSSLEIKRVLKHVFPGITFVGLYSGNEGAIAIDKVLALPLKLDHLRSIDIHKECYQGPLMMSIIIISYN